MLPHHAVDTTLDPPHSTIEGWGISMGDLHMPSENPKGFKDGNQGQDR